MQLNRKGQMAGYEALIILILLGVSGYMFYLYSHKSVEANIYQAGSKPIVYQNEPNIHPLCGMIFSYNDKEKENVTNKTTH